MLDAIFVGLFLYGFVGITIKAKVVLGVLEGRLEGWSKDLLGWEEACRILFCKDIYIAVRFAFWVLGS